MCYSTSGTWRWSSPNNTLLSKLNLFCKSTQTTSSNEIRRWKPLSCSGRPIKTLMQHVFWLKLPKNWEKRMRLCFWSRRSTFWRHLKSTRINSAFLMPRWPRLRELARRRQMWQPRQWIRWLQVTYQLRRTKPSQIHGKVQKPSTSSYYVKDNSIKSKSSLH